jgi:hypothetical protein
MYKQKDAKLSIPVKAESEAGALTHYPVKVSGDLKKNLKGQYEEKF